MVDLGLKALQGCKTTQLRSARDWEGGLPPLRGCAPGLAPPLVLLKGVAKGTHLDLGCVLSDSLQSPQCQAERISSIPSRYRRSPPVASGFYESESLRAQRFDVDDIQV